MEALPPLAKLALAVGLALLLWPLARRAGRAEAGRMQGLADDLRHGRPGGMAILAVVGGMVALTFLLGPS